MVLIFVTFHQGKVSEKEFAVMILLLHASSE
ncbi:MAG: hypothetical protein ACI9EK_002922 [Psychroserpens sp.]|jgi:hypothetical protein